MESLAAGRSHTLRGSQETATKEAPPAAPVRDPQKTIQDKAAAEPAPDASAQLALKAQRFTTRKAKLAFEIAKLMREFAEITAEEYQEVTYPRYLTAAEGEEKLAQSELERARDEVNRARLAAEKTTRVTASQVSAELKLKKAEFDNEQAAEKKRVLEQYSNPKAIKDHRSEVEKAASDELAKEAILKLEVAKERKMERELKEKGE